MATIFDEFIKILEDEYIIYNELLMIGKEKKNIIINNDLDTLQKMNTVENSLAGKLKKLESRRLDTVNDIKIVLNLKDNLTLTSLAESLKDENDKQMILNINEKIKSSLDELRNVNELNRTLIENSLEYIEFSMNLIKNVKEMNTGTYSKNDLKK